jgi:hypothetical protein
MVLCNVIFLSITIAMCSRFASTVKEHKHQREIQNHKEQIWKNRSTAARNMHYHICCRRSAEVADSFGISPATYPQFLTPLQTGSGCLSICYTREWPTAPNPPQCGI